MKYLKTYKLFENKHTHEYIVYHSSNNEITEFNFDYLGETPGSSTRIDALFFSDIPQKSWGENVYKIKIISNHPAIYDISKSRFDSLSIQEAFDALLRQNPGYIIEDLIDYGDMAKEDAEKLAYDWVENLDLIILINCNYAKHNIEYIVPDVYYNGKSAKIINLGKI